MQQLTWSDDFSIHIAQFDNEHRLLFGLMNELAGVQNMPEPLQKQIHQEILQQLQEAFTNHIRSEEAFMTHNAYPAERLEEHRKKHAALRANLHEFTQCYQVYSKTMSNDMVTFLHDWLTNHIIVYDRLLGEYFAQKPL